jgi:hypothetical protein
VGHEIVDGLPLRRVVLVQADEAALTAFFQAIPSDARGIRIVTSRQQKHAAGR